MVFHRKHLWTWAAWLIMVAYWEIVGIAQELLNNNSTPVINASLSLMAGFLIYRITKPAHGTWPLRVALTFAASAFNDVIYMTCGLGFTPSSVIRFSYQSVTFLLYFVGLFLLCMPQIRVYDARLTIIPRY